MIYLDSAATALLKPDSVSCAVLEAMRDYASPGRGGYPAAVEAGRICLRCRENLARLFHVPEPDNVVFTMNATHGLNIAIRSLIRPGSRVVISGYEHNAVTRPLNALGAEMLIVDTPLFDRSAFLRDFYKKIRRAEAAVCIHVSNVFGFVLPLEEIAEQCRALRKPLIVDASQSAGVLDLDFDALGAEFAAMPGHKGLLGPQGTGVLLCRSTAKPLLYGGSGSDSLSQNMPDYLPDRLEAGTQNVSGIAGLNAGVEYILETGTESIRRKERFLRETMEKSLEGTFGLRLFAAKNTHMQTGVLSVLPEKGTLDPDTLGEALYQKNVAVRTGLHCAPLAHKTAGTLDTGTLRLSFSPFNSTEEVRRAAAWIRDIVQNAG